MEQYLIIIFKFSEYVVTTFKSLSDNIWLISEDLEVVQNAIDLE